MGMCLTISDYSDYNEINDYNRDMFYKLTAKKYSKAIRKLDRFHKIFFRFIHCKEAKLFYVEFILNFSSLKNMAIELLEIVKSGELSFSELIISYRIEQEIRYKENIANKKKVKSHEITYYEELLDKTEILKLESDMQNLIEKSLVSNTYMLEYLKEEIVDIERLYHSIRDSHFSTYNCHLYWDKNPKIERKNLKSKLIYGVFLRDILNMKKTGNKIIEEFYQSKKLEGERLKNILNIKFSNTRVMIESNSLPLCLIYLAHGEKIKIKNCNGQFARILNMTKGNLIGKNLSEIIGNFSKKFYVDLLKRTDLFYATKRFNLSFKISKKIYKIFGVETRVLNRRDESYGLLKINFKNNFRPEGDLLVNSKGIIFGFSTSCLNVFGYDNIKIMMNEKKSIYDIAENFENCDKITKSFHIFLKDGKKLKVESRNMSDSKLKWMKFLRPDDNFSVRDFNGLIEKEEKENLETKEKLIRNFKNYTITGSEMFEFRLDTKLNYTGKFHINNLEKKTQLLKLEETEKKMMLSKITLKFLSMDENIISSKRIDYGVGIRTKRLVDGYIRDINDFFSDDSEEIIEENQEKEKILKDENSQNIISNFNLAFATNGVRNSFLNIAPKADVISKEKIQKIKENFKKKSMKFTKYQKILLTISLIFSMILIIHQFIVNLTLNSYLSRVKLLNEISNTAGIRNASVVGISLKLFDMILTNKGFDFTSAYDPNWTREQYNEENLNYIKFYFDDYKTYQNKLLDLYANFHNKETVKSLNEDKYIELISEGVKKSYNFADSQNILYASVIKVLGLKPENFTRENKDVDFLFRNIFEQVLRRFPRANAVRFAEIDELNKTKLEFYNLNISIAGIFSLIVLVFFFFLVGCVYKEIEDRVKICIGFDSEYIKQLLKKNLMLIKKLQNNFANDIDDEEFYDDLEEKKVEIKERRKTRKYKNFGRRRRTKGSIIPIIGILKFSIFILIFGNFYLTRNGYLRTNDLIKKGLGYAVSFRTILVSDSVLHSVQTMLHMMLYEEDYAFFEKPTRGYILGFIPFSRQLIGEFYFVIFSNNTMNYKMDAELQANYDKYFYSNICDYYEEIQLPVKQHEVNCENFMNGWMKHSFFTALQHYHESILDLYSKMNFIYGNKNLEEFPFTNNCPEKYKKKIDGEYRFNWCLLTSKEALEIKLFHQHIHKPITMKMNDAGKKAVQGQIKTGFNDLGGDFVFKFWEFLIWNLLLVIVMNSFRKKVSGIEEMLVYHNGEELAHNSEFVKYLKEI